jgi:hypothetical protein
MSLLSFEAQTVEFLKTHTFRPHPFGERLLFGLNGFGCDSVILFEELIWKFLYFDKKNQPIYINAQAQKRPFDLNNDTNVRSKTTRMEAI